ncbi:immunity 22 family protein [Siccationidurans soli]|uniref:Immunity 22 family protein n=2 Tax=Hymenobacter negativus TaxID=2795026 RepID=A0ABS3QQH6_9BACT|nr:immunity 22 family protein [Hymenobacter negativus]
MTKIHVWIGYSLKSSDEFYEYFSIDEADKEAGIGASQFDKDLHMHWYDDDLIGIYFSEVNNSLDTALDEIATSPATIDDIRAKCSELGITEANAMFYYMNSELEVSDNSKKYNGLTYLGIFDND